MSDDKFDIKTAKAADLHAVELTKFKHVHYISGGLGSTGVFIANTGSGWIVCKAVNTRTAGEIYAAFLGNALGVKCPEYRFHDPDKLGAVITALKYAPAASEEETHMLRNARIQAVVAMNFVEGFTLPAVGLKVLMESSASSLFKQFGQMTVFDMVTNNFDRIPFIWSNNGNFENLMVQGNVFEDDGKLTAASIDQGTTCITNENGVNDYRQKLVDAVQEAFKDQVDLGSAYFKRLKVGFENNTGVELTKEMYADFLEGVRDGCKSLAAKLEENPDLIYQKVQETLEFIAPVAEYHDTGIGLLDGDFLNENVQTIIKTTKAAQAS